MTNTSSRRQVPGLAVVGLCLLVATMATSSRPRAAEDLPMATPESVGMSSERLQRVDEYFQRFIDDNQIAGAVTLVARKGKVVHHSALEPAVRTVMGVRPLPDLMANWPCWGSLFSWGSSFAANLTKLIRALLS